MKNPQKKSTGSSLSNNSSYEKSTVVEGVVKHSPQSNITPKRSILKKSNSSRMRQGHISRNTSIKKTTIDRSVSTLSRSTMNGNSYISTSNVSSPEVSGISGNVSHPIEEDEITSLHSIGRHNTVNTVSSSISSVNGMRLPPVLSAFRHALPTPPTPKSTKFYGPDGELLSGQVVNDELVVPDILIDAIGRDNYSYQDIKNVTFSYGTLNRKNKKLKHNNNDDDITSKKSDDSSLDIVNINQRNSISQEYLLGNELKYHNSIKASSFRQDLLSPRDLKNENLKPSKTYNDNNISDTNIYALRPKRASHITHSRTLPRYFGSSKTINNYDNGVSSKKNKSNTYSEEEQTKPHTENEYVKSHSRHSSMEADYIIKNTNLSLTNFEKDLLKDSLTGKNKSYNANSVLAILKEESNLLNQIDLETP